MARTKSTTDGESSYSYFKRLFQEKPHLLKEKSNSVILAEYRNDHGMAADAEVEKKVTNNMTNLKSVMRKGIRKKTAANAAAAGVAVVPSSNRLERLEEAIDDCLTLARTLDRDSLSEVIVYLRRARNKVVWKMGEK